MKQIILFASLVLGVFLMQCSDNNPTASSGGTDTGNAALVSGKLYALNGKPIKNARVHFIPVSYNPNPLSKALATTDTVTTNDSGLYSTDDLDAGTYNVFGEDSAGNLSLLDSAVVPKDTTVLPSDTLKAPGSLKGFIRMQGTDDPRTVFVILFGTGTVALPMTTGEFNLTNLAEGTYSVRLLSTLDDYGVVDTSFSILAGIDDVMPDTIVLPYNGIPVPTGLSIEYDTLKQVVTLLWNTPTTGALISGYNIYRKHQDSSIVLLKADWQDTIFVDSTVLQDSMYEYRVAAVDTFGTEGVKSSPRTILIASLFVYKRAIGISGSGVGQYQAPSDVVVSSDGIVYISDYIGNKVLLFDTLGNFVKEDTGFKAPLGIALRTRNSYFVLEDQNKLIKLIDSTGSIIFQINGGFVGGFASSQFTPWKMTISPTGNLYIVDAGNNRVRAYDSTGSFIKDIPVNFQPQAIQVLDSTRFVLGFSNTNGNTAIIDTSGTILSQFNNGPQKSIAITANGNFIGGWDYSSIRIISSTGTLIGRYVYTAAHADNAGIATDSNGNVFISMLNSQKVIMVFNNKI